MNMIVIIMIFSFFAFLSVFHDSVRGNKGGGFAFHNFADLPAGIELEYSQLDYWDIAAIVVYYVHNLSTSSS